MQQNATARIQLYCLLLCLSFSSSQIATPNRVHAEQLESDGTVDGALPLFTSTSGRNCTVFASAGMATSTMASLSLELPVVPVSALLFWSGRDRDNQGDNSILLNGSTVEATVTHQGKSGGGSWWHSYISDVTARIAAIAARGEMPVTLDISDLTMLQNDGGENHGVGLIVLYSAPECPRSELNLHFGLDSFKQSAPSPVFGPNSAVTCTQFVSSAKDRLVDLTMVVGGIGDASRNVNIWLATLSGANQPISLIGQESPQIGAWRQADPIGNNPLQHQLDLFQTTIELPAHHSQACVQIESVVPHGASAIFTHLTAAARDKATARSIEGLLWRDSNQNGVREANEEGIAGLVVLLREPTVRTIVGSFVTNGSGAYHFGELQEDMYVVDVAEELFLIDWIQTAESDGTLDTETTVILTDSSVVRGIDFGFIDKVQPGSISGIVWRDLNGNGQYESAEEPGIEGIQVNLQAVDSSAEIPDQTTDESGLFSFVDLPRERFLLHIEAGDLAILQTFEVDGQLDGEVAVDLTSVPDQAMIDFGYGEFGRIGGRLWNDANSNGLQDAGEAGLNNVLLLLIDERSVGRVTATLSDGNYVFGGLLPGNYSVVVVLGSLPGNPLPTFEVDGTLDGRTDHVIPISAIIDEIDFGYNLGPLGLQTPPVLDITNLGVDLHNEQAIIELLWAMEREEANPELSEPPGTIETESEQTAIPSEPVLREELQPSGQDDEGGQTPSSETGGTEPEADVNVYDQTTNVQVPTLNGNPANTAEIEDSDVSDETAEAENVVGNIFLYRLHIPLVLD